MEYANSLGGTNTTLILFCPKEYPFLFAFTYDMVLHNTPKCENFHSIILKQLLTTLYFPPKYVIALAIEGKMLDSEELARKLGQLGVGGVSQVVFVIGGSLGLSGAVLERADYRLIFSKMTP